MKIRVGPSQFRSTANPVRRVPAKGVVGRLNSKKEYNKIKRIKNETRDPADENKKKEEHLYPIVHCPTTALSPV